jgi:flagellum-specific ATP synthase
MKDVTTPQHQAAALTIRQLMAAHSEHEDLLSIGAYRRGSNRTLDVSVEMREAIDELLRQSLNAALPYHKVVEQLTTLAAECQAKMSGATSQPTAAPAAAKPN